MSPRLSEILSRERALIFRITHVKNLPWILGNGIWCANGERKDPNFVSIGNPDLIAKRPTRAVEIEPGGGLGDYVPFYFTPRSPMLYNIRTGWGGITKRENEEIVVLVSSLPELERRGVRYVFTDRHAYLAQARFFASRAELDAIDFDILRRSDFASSPEDPGKIERYQAEALVYEGLPTEALMGIGCYTSEVKEKLEAAAREAGVELRIEVRPDWYFR